MERSKKQVIVSMVAVIVLSVWFCYIFGLEVGIFSLFAFIGCYIFGFYDGGFYENEK